MPKKADATDNNTGDCHTGRATLNITAVRRKRSPRSFSRRRTGRRGVYRWYQTSGGLRPALSYFRPRARQTSPLADSPGLARPSAVGAQTRAIYSRGAGQRRPALHMQDRESAHPSAGHGFGELRAPDSSPRHGPAWPVLSEGRCPGDAADTAALVLASQEFVANGGRRPSGRGRHTAASPGRTNSCGHICRRGWLRPRGAVSETRIGSTETAASSP
jgi:hypothetical protein